MCKLCEDRIAKERAETFSAGVATGAAYGPAVGAEAPTGAAYRINLSMGSTVEQETKRMDSFAKDASVTRSPREFLGAPSADGTRYAIGYTDAHGVKRVFTVDTEDAEALAQGMLQEIEAVKNKNERVTLINKLRRIVSDLDKGLDVDIVLDQLADLSSGG